MKGVLASVSRNSILLAGFAIAMALLIAGTFLQTRERIAEQQRRAEEKALLEILPAGAHDNALLEDTLPAPVGDDLLQLQTPRAIYRARQGGEVSALVLPARAPDGYSGSIQLIVGVARNGKITGVRVVEHRETPGLGDKIERRKSDWIEAFRGRSLNNTASEAWAVRKEGGDFDQFTGATVTPRAVIAATHRTLQYVAQERERLFAGPGATGNAASTQGDSAP
jgi:electron transport complex protein RnfG